MKVLINFIHYPVYVLGIGKRVGIWFQGCSIRCKGCMSQYTWEFNKAYERNLETVLNELTLFNTDKITISGGEPFDQPEGLKELLKGLKERNFNDILVYSGYDFEFLQEKYSDIIKYIDVLITGKFEEGKETDKIWKGSENQEMYILNDKLKETYTEYMKEKKKKELQMVEIGDEIYIIGIPYQKDIKGIINGFM